MKLILVWCLVCQYVVWSIRCLWGVFSPCEYMFLSPWTGSLKLFLSYPGNNSNKKCHYSDAFIVSFSCLSVVVSSLSPSLFNSKKNISACFSNPPKWCTTSAKLWSWFQYFCIVGCIQCGCRYNIIFFMKILLYMFLDFIFEGSVLYSL